MINAARCYAWTLLAVGGVGLLLLAAPVGVSVHAEENDAQTTAPPTLTELGLAFDQARLRPHAQRTTALGELVVSMAELLDRGVDSKRKSAAYFLSAEIRLAHGDYAAAVKDFEKAGKKGPFADDAAFAVIIALEAQGRDNDAAKKWQKWDKRYPDSPLAPEALLARTWNALRRDSLARAERILVELKTRFPFMEANPRTTLAEATIAYLQNRPQDALALLGNSNNDVEAHYLRALCFEASGDALKAAARYQEIAERFPHSVLRDRAMLAKANIFLRSAAYQSAAEEFDRTVEKATLPDVKKEAELRSAVCLFLDGRVETATDRLHDITSAHAGTDVAARAQLILGEVLLSEARYEDAILELNRVLTDYFEHELAASAQYRVGRCLDALERHNEATSAYRLVVSGYPLADESPAAAYLAGVGLLGQDLPQAASPYFQLVIDRYAHDATDGRIGFSSPEHQELVEASLCLLEWSYHRAGNMGQLSGVPHMMLQKMPPSSSPWRAYALLIDADALAAQARHDEAQGVLEKLIGEFPEHSVSIPANRLLAWTYAQQGKDDLAIETENRMLARYASQRDSEHLSSAYLNKAHVFFNAKRYKEAAETYDDFLNRFPGHPQRLVALYQAGLCHYRLSRTGDAVDRWEDLVTENPSAEIAERAWSRAGDVYFQADHYEDARRCYRGLIDNFPQSRATALGMLRLAQCDYNAERDEEALEGYSAVIALFAGTGIAAEAQRGIERALYRLGQRGDGAEVLTQLVERFPTSAFAADAQFEIATRRYEAKQFREAADEFRRVVSQFPSYSAADRAQYLMADAYSQAGELEQARLGYEQFLTFFPESEFRITVRFRLGSLRFDDENYMQAAVDFTTVLEGETSDEIAAAALFNFALCQRMLGATVEAKAGLERYRERFPKDERAAQVAYQLGDIYENTGEFEKADKGLVTELNYRIGTCREQLADDAGAIKAYKKAIASKSRTDAFRLSAVARCAALYEKSGDYQLAIGAYRDLIKHAEDPEIVLAAKERASQLEAIVK
jgi:TolA-binding protein